MTRTLIRGGCVLTLGRANFAKADVLVEDGVIAEVAPAIRVRDAEVVDATDAIVMPGFVDAHRHAWESLVRNVGDGAAATLVGPHYRPDDVYAAILVGLLGAVEAGITTVADWCAVATERPHLEAALQAHHDAGIASVLVYAAPPWAPETWDPRWLAEPHTGPGRRLAAGSPDPRLGDLESLTAAWSAVRALGLRIHAHAGTSPTDGGVVTALSGAGLLDDDVTLIHCAHLDDADLDAIAASGSGVVLAPSSAMAGGVGAPPIQGLVDRGVRPGLASESERMAPGDLFAQMRATISVQHASHFELKLAGKAGLPRLLTTRDVIRYGTLGGASALGIDDVTGTLEPGKRADLIVLRTDRPNIHPVNDPIGAVVWGMDTSNISWVFAAGRALMQDGVLDADVDRARRLALEARRSVGEASGILVGEGA